MTNQEKLDAILDYVARNVTDFEGDAVKNREAHRRAIASILDSAKLRAAG